MFARFRQTKHGYRSVWVPLAEGLRRSRAVSLWFRASASPDLETYQPAVYG
jgi:hypothetical protein